MDIIRTTIPGCLEIRIKKYTDNRGTFVKTFEADFFLKNNLMTVFKEEFHSKSRKNVIRGLHFQLPPFEQDKIVYCASGEIMDVVLDMRKGSPAYGKHRVFTLSEKLSNVLYIPAGLAHGYCVLSTSAIVMYKVTAAHSQAHDTGIRWDSAGIAWPVKKPVMSARDRALPVFADFKTPFTYKKKGAR